MTNLAVGTLEVLLLAPFSEHCHAHSTMNVIERAQVNATDRGLELDAGVGAREC